MKYTQVIRNLAWLETAQNEVYEPCTNGPVAANKFFYWNFVLPNPIKSTFFIGIYLLLDCIFLVL